MRFRSSVLPVLAALAIPASAGAVKTAKKAVPAVKADAAPAVPAPRAGMRRFMVVRTFPAGALEGLDASGKKQVNEKNSSQKVRWVYSYANADKTKTFCIYEGPDEKAIREAASANKIPVDYIVEVPVVLTPR
jgi:uncharacterized protein DUF4242